jgi:hypothetical protein
MPTYSGDPYWLTARFTSKCRCGAEIPKGARAFYYPRTKTCLCEKCGEPAAREFDAAAADEAQYSGQSC